MRAPRGRRKREREREREVLLFGHVARLGGWVNKHKGAQTAIGPSQSPSRSLETARPVGRASALDLCPGAKVSGTQTDLLTPWYDVWAEIIPFQYSPVLFGGKGTSHVG